MRSLWTREEINNVKAHLQSKHRESLRMPEEEKKPVGRDTPERAAHILGGSETEKDPFIVAKVPFVKSDVFYRWNYIIKDMWDAYDGFFATRLTEMALNWFAPHIDITSLMAQLDSEVEIMFGAVAEAIENGNMKVLASVCDGHLRSLIEDNFAEFRRLHEYRLAVHDIQARRVALKATWKFPPFARETPSSIELWSGTALVFSQPLNSKPVEDTILWMTQAVGTCYAFFKRQAVIADTPPNATGGLAAFPVPDRFNTESHVKKRVLNYIKKPLLGDLAAFIKFIRAMRRYGFRYVLFNGSIEIQLVYGIDCKHDLSVLPIYEEPVDESAEAAKSPQEKEREKIVQKLKYPEFKDHHAPHVLVLTSTFPMHPDGEKAVKTRPWLISEIDGIRRSENLEVENLLKLSTLSPEQIDTQLPALRICSKNLFTPLGPKKEWFQEMERLRRVSQNYAETGKLDDPEENSLDSLVKSYQAKGMSPVDVLLAKSRPLPHSKLSKDGKSPSAAPSSSTGQKPIGNIFDLARDHHTKS
jgi:hypothetical protein